MDDFEERLGELQQKLEIDEKRERLKVIEKEMAEPSFWSDREGAAKISKEFADRQKEIEEFEKLQELYRQRNFPELEKGIKDLELKTFLSGPYDQNDAVLAIHAGAGGTEAMDWTEMLLRMYQKYVESRGWKWSILEQSWSEEAGLKSVTFEV